MTTEKLCKDDLYALLERHLGDLFYASNRTVLHGPGVTTQEDLERVQVLLEQSIDSAKKSLKLISALKKVLSTAESK